MKIHWIILGEFAGKVIKLSRSKTDVITTSRQLRIQMNMEASQNCDNEDNTERLSRPHQQLSLTPQHPQSQSNHRRHHHEEHHRILCQASHLVHLLSFLGKGHDLPPDSLVRATRVVQQLVFHPHIHCKNAENNLSRYRQIQESLWFNYIKRPDLPADWVFRRRWKPR